MSDTTLAMSDEPVLSPTSAANASSNNSTLAGPKGLNLSSSTPKDYPDQSNSPDSVYKNNNNNNNIEDSVSPPSRDVVTNFSIESHLLGAEDSNSNHHTKPIFKRRDSFNSDECKMNISPKERERTLSTVMEEDQEEMNMQYSPKSGTYPPSAGGESGGGGLSKFSQDDGGDYSQHHHLAATLQSKRPIFNEGGDMRDHHQQSLHQHSHPDYDRANHEGHHLPQSRGGILHHDFMGEQDQTEEMSENEEEMVCDDYESDSDTNEPRITVREALMNRALAAAAAAAAAAGSSSAASHFAAAAGERSGELFSSEQGGSGRTSRSGGVSPSSSPGVRSSSTSGIASGRNNESSSSGSSHNNNNTGSALSKEAFVNGHAGLRPPVSHSAGERYHSQHHSSSHHGQHQRSSSYGAHHHQQHLSSHHHHQSGQSSHSLSSHSSSTPGSGGISANSKLSSQQYRENLGIKSERKSHSSSPLQSEVKPENLAALSNLSNIQNLLNLASLGSLAALQQSLPGLLSSVSGGNGGGATRAGSPGNNGSGSSPSHTSPHAGGVGGSSSSPSTAAPPASGMNAPLNLTHSSGGGLAPSSSKPHHLPHHHHHQLGGGHMTGSSGNSASTNNSSNNNSSSHHSSSRGQHSSSPYSHHQSAFTHANSLGSGSGGGVNPASMLGGGGGLIPPNLAAYFSQAAAVAAGTGGRSGSPSSQFIPNSSQLTNSLSHAASSVQSPGSLPQLVLASGQIMQGIQGAQLLIPTSQGIMTQMILTIPLTQPGSPATAQNAASPAIGSASGQNSSSPHSRSARSQGRSHHHGLPQCSANSPPIASTVPPSASPDYSGPGGAMSGSLLNLSPHLVNQSLGAHIPLDKMGMDRVGGINGVRSSSMKRDNTGSVISPNPNLPMSALYPPKMSPCSEGGHDSDKCSEGGDSDQMVDGINLDEIKEFAKAFKLRRLSLGLTQTQVGQALSVTEGPAYSQSAICSALAWQLAQSQSQLSQSNRTSLPQPSMFEKLDITPKSAQKIKPVLERWMKEAEDRYKNGHQNLNEFVGMEPSKKRKRRTSFTPQALEILNTQFERNTHPSGAEITTLAHQLGYEREVIRIWFCNKRQALKNTVRMMSKGSSPI